MDKVAKHTQFKEKVLEVLDPRIHINIFLKENSILNNPKHKKYNKIVAHQII